VIGNLSISFDSGTKLKELVKKPNYKQIFMFSAVTWNRHMIHYNSETARNEGLPDVVVQRALIGNYFAQLLTQWAGENAELKRLEWKVLRSAIPGDKLVCQGEVVAKLEQNSCRLANCKIQMMNQKSEILATGQAQMEFYS
jgi:hydroxyacyl-ACP dehydratase HTD2-like protein with hotdog domain